MACKEDVRHEQAIEALKEMRILKPMLGDQDEDAMEGPAFLSVRLQQTTSLGQSY